MPVKTKKADITKVIGVTGLSIWSGVLGEEYLTALKGTRRAKVFKEMQDDAVIGTLLDAMSMPLLAAEFDTVAAGESQKDKDNAEFLYQVMNDMTRYTWRQHVLDKLTMLAWGWAAEEMVFKKRMGADGTPASQYSDGKIGLHILDPRGQETLYRWKMDEEFNVEKMVQKDPNSSKMIEIDSWKLLHSTFRSRKRSPEGSSPLRSLYRAWYTRKNLEIIEAIGAERDLCGLPVVYLPYGAGETEKTEAETLVRNIRQDEEAGLVIPPPLTPDSKHGESGWKFELLSSAGSKQFNVREIIRDLNKIILMRFFAQFLLLGMEQVGTQALVQGSQDFFSLCLKSVQQELLETWNLQLVPLIFNLNPGMLAGASGLPTIDWSDPGSKDVQKAAAIALQLIQANILTPDEKVEDFFRAMMGLPDRPEGIGEGPRGITPSGPLGGLMNYEWYQTGGGAWIVRPKQQKIYAQSEIAKAGDEVDDDFIDELEADVPKLLNMLDDGASPEEALGALSDEHSGFSAYWVISQVVKKSKRGEELRKAWNAHCGSPDVKGLIDPSSLVIAFKKYAQPDVGDVHIPTAIGKITCECPQCGYRTETEGYCSALKCPKCSTTMRRVERPGQCKRALTPEEWQDMYEEGLPHWATDMEPSQFAQEFVEELKKQNVKAVLEIGCGNGRDSILFAQAGFKVTAIDAAPAAIELAKGNAEKAGVQIEFRIANAEKLPFNDKSYDAVFTLSVLHSTKLSLSLSEMARVMKTGAMGFVYLYSETTYVSGKQEQFVSVEAFTQMLKANSFELADFYTENEEQYDEFGEKHRIVVALVKKV